MPRRDIKCRCGGTGSDGCPVRENADFGIAHLRSALASDAEHYRGLASAMFVDRPGGLFAAVAIDALYAGTTSYASAGCPIQRLRELPAPQPVSDLWSDHARKERHDAERP